jgi:hypothetical protein
VTRVLLGDFSALLRLGFVDVFEAHGLELIQTEADDILKRLVEALPHAVVLDLDKEGVVELARRIESDFPAVRVIACSSVASTMRIFPPFHYGESYESELSAAVLARALRG